MKQPVLVILAAGMGSRYGGLKQIDAVGDNGECIIDFSIYDAIRAGFKKVILIIRREHEAAFDKALVNKIKPFIEVEYAFQDMDDLPQGFTAPEQRVKPWGTTHAILACRKVLHDEPFAVINADDYYGREAFVKIYDFLVKDVREDEYGMVGYVVSNTLTDNGTVTRGVCEVSDGYLKKIVERHQIKKTATGPFYTEDGEHWVALPQDNLVSMNFWGFSAGIMDRLMPIFTNFLKNNFSSDPLKCEHVIPTAVDELINQQGIRVRVLRSEDTWKGITYKEDKPVVIAAFAELKAAGVYPADLWK